MTYRTAQLTAWCLHITLEAKTQNKIIIDMKH